MKLSTSQRNMLETLADAGTFPDIAMMILFGPQWRKTAQALEQRGFVGANRAGWFITAVGKEHLG